jgi:pterin-4a-carbinolamine dehydratase
MDSSERFKADRDEARTPTAETDRFKADRDEHRSLGVEAVREQLARLPGWELVREGAILQRRYRVAHFRAALAFAAFVGEVAQSGAIEPEIVVGFSSVQVRIHAPTGKTVGASDLDLAAALDFVGR